jgi:hypothetical protein
MFVKGGRWAEFALRQDSLVQILSIAFFFVISSRRELRLSLNSRSFAHELTSYMRTLVLSWY